MATNLIVNVRDPRGTVIATANVEELATSDNKNLANGDVVIPVTSLLVDSPIPPVMLGMLKGLTIHLSLDCDDDWTMPDVARALGNLGFVAPELLGERIESIRQRCENA